MEMYGGIGSQLKALTNIGIEISSHTLIEVDIDATISYASIHCELNQQIELYLFPTKDIMVAELLPFNWWRNDKPYNVAKLKEEKLQKLYLSQKLTNNLGDVFKLKGEDLPTVDLITWSTPCQDFSLAGKQKGFEGAKGGLTYITLELFKQLKELNKLPKFLLFENVPALVSEKFKYGFDVMVRELQSLGFENHILRMNAKNYGIPQNRDRVFILSIHKDYLQDYYYQIPNPVKLKLKLKDMLQDNVDGKYNLSAKTIAKLKRHNNKSVMEKSIPGIAATCIAGYAKLGRDQQYIVDEKYYLSDKMLKYINSYDSNEKENGKGTYQVSKERLVLNREIASVVSTRTGQNRADSSDYISKKLPDNFNVNGMDLTKIIQLNNPTHSNDRIYSDEGLSPTINTMQGGNRQPFIAIPEATKKGYAKATIGDGVDIGYPESETRRGRVKDKISHTITTQSELGVVVNEPMCLNSKVNGKQPSLQDRIYDDKGISTAITTCFMPNVSTNLKIRKLTPLECFRLMGFDDVDYNNASEHISNSQLYKQAGNSIVVNVLEHIFTNLLLG